MSQPHTVHAVPAENTVTIGGKDFFVWVHTPERESFAINCELTLGQKVYVTGRYGVAVVAPLNGQEKFIRAPTWYSGTPPMTTILDDIPSGEYIVSKTLGFSDRKVLTRSRRDDIVLRHID